MSEPKVVIWGLLEDPYPYPYEDLLGEPWVIHCKVSLGDVVMDVIMVYPSSDIPLRLSKHFERDIQPVITELPPGSEIRNYKDRMN